MSTPGVASAPGSLASRIDRQRAIEREEHAAGLPPEFIHFLRRGLAKDPTQRFQSVAQMLDELQAIAEGRIRVECAFTAMRRTGNEFNRMVRDRPMMALTAFGMLIGMALFGVVAAVLMIALSR